jgi:hypothetical protein
VNFNPGPADDPQFVSELVRQGLDHSAASAQIALDPRRFFTT